VLTDSHPHSVEIWGTQRYDHSRKWLNVIGGTLRKSFLRTIVCITLWIVPTSAVEGQTSATFDLPNGNAIAGDQIKGKLTFDSAPSCRAQVVVMFRQGTPSDNKQFAVSGFAEPNAQTVIVQGDLPKDISPGKYQSVEAYLLPCVGFSRSRPLKIPVLPIDVRALPDPNHYPDSADFALTWDQRHFFDTKVSDLEQLERRIDKQLQGHARDDANLRAFLLQIVKEAQDALDETARQYQGVMKQKKLPEFFAEFRKDYEDLSSELNAPIPGHALLSGTPRLLLVSQQLQPRPPQQGHVEPRNLAGTVPIAAIAVKKTVGDNAGAYSYISETGRTTFDASVSSHPDGAQIQYKMALESGYLTYSSQTNVPHISLELATWDFKFHSDRCRDEQYFTLDPYRDSERRISVEFKDCKPK
jgi:hypothetical protein